MPTCSEQSAGIIPLLAIAIGVGYMFKIPNIPVEEAKPKCQLMFWPDGINEDNVHVIRNKTVCEVNKVQFPKIR